MGISFPRRDLVSQADAARIESNRTPRSKFLNRWGRKTTFDAGYLVPFMVDEVLPGDHMQYDVTAYVRMQTPLFPLFDDQRVDTFFFYVPARLLWQNWARFMGEQDDPTSGVNYVVPVITSAVGGWATNSLADHFGLPVAGQVGAAATMSVNALPFRAYNRIWNEWFRDQNIQNSANNPVGDGPDNDSFYPLQRRAKSHDYFTSALPWPQKFTPPGLPLGGLAPVLGIGHNQAQTAVAGPINNIWEPVGGAVSYANYAAASTASSIVIKTDAATPTARPMVYADLGQATGIPINTLRQAWLVQSLLENDARGGTRYTEIIRNHFGVINPDFRLQRPEYIGGGQTPLMVTPIAQTTPTAGVPVGALGAAATAAGKHRASYAATEHGYILGLINVRSELSYQQGVWKLWDRSTRYDFYWPELATLGEQAINRREIYADGTAQDLIVFGYQERYQEYRTRVSEVTGRFRSYVTGTMDNWHLAQRFTSAPVLNTAFIVDDPPMARVLAAGALALTQQYLADIEIRRTAVRPIPMFGTPAALGRF